MIADKTTIQLFEIFEDFNKNLLAGREGLSNREVTNLVDKITAVIKANSYIGKVNIFMTTFRQPMSKKPMPSRQIALRLSLLLEELGELAIASGTVGIKEFQVLLKKQVEKFNTIPQVGEHDLVEVFDALIDLQYVLSGAVLSWGMQDQFDEGFEEVQSSNMSKVCDSTKTCGLTVDKYNEEGIETTALPLGDDRWLVMRHPDYKVLKSVKYRPASLSPILNID